MFSLVGNVAVSRALSWNEMCVCACVHVVTCGAKSKGEKKKDDNGKEINTDTTKERENNPPTSPSKKKTIPGPSALSVAALVRLPANCPSHRAP